MDAARAGDAGPLGSSIRGFSEKILEIAISVKNHMLKLFNGSTLMFIQPLCNWGCVSMVSRRYEIQKEVLIGQSYYD